MRQTTHQQADSLQSSTEAITKFRQILLEKEQELQTSKDNMEMVQTKVKEVVLKLKDELKQSQEREEEQTRLYLQAQENVKKYLQDIQTLQTNLQNQETNEANQRQQWEENLRSLQVEKDEIIVNLKMQLTSLEVEIEAVKTVQNESKSTEPIDSNQLKEFEELATTVSKQSVELMQWEDRYQDLQSQFQIMKEEVTLKEHEIQTLQHANSSIQSENQSQLIDAKRQLHAVEILQEEGKTQIEHLKEKSIFLENELQQAVNEVLRLRRQQQQDEESNGELSPDKDGLRNGGVTVAGNASQGK